MRTHCLKWLVAASLLFAAIVHRPTDGKAGAADAPPTRILIVVGPSLHPPGTHEAAANGRLLKHCLEHAQGIKPVAADLFFEWPQDKKVLGGAASVVFFGDLFPPDNMKDSAAINADLTVMMNRGCGMACVHYATGAHPPQVTAAGDHPLLRWTGGYFSAGSPHHRSVARVTQATLSPEPIAHPVLRGWKAFSFEDEPYWNNYFGPTGPAKNVTALVSSMLPPESPKKETVVWAIERPDGGRGVGIVVPHFFRNWQLDDLRTLMLNAVCWTAKIEIPVAGVKATLPDLATFKPESVNPVPPPVPQTPAK
jgi:type 1 glutamine amidotransferase